MTSSRYSSKRNIPVPLNLLLFLCFIHGVQTQQRLIKHIFAESPASSPTHHSPQFEHGLRRIILSVVLGIFTGLIGVLLFACLLRFFVRFLNRAPLLKGPVIFSPQIDSKTLQSALSNENQLLGSSPNGKYYRTVLGNGLTVAVKRLEPFDAASPEANSKTLRRRIQQELEILAGLRHRNLMRLRAYVRETDRFSLVYDYMPSGSLEDAMKRMRENKLQLGWDVRLRIAVGIIKGLHYLHFGCIPQVVHYNLKPSNVMLDADCEPRLADCSLAKLFPNLDREASAYTAPECFHNFRYTDKSDVFSFGVILGVLLTGRDPADPFFAEAAGGGSFGWWLSHLQQAGEAREALEKSLLGEEIEEDEMLMAVKIAVVCLSDLPNDRPSSDELVSMLTQLQFLK